MFYEPDKYDHGLPFNPFKSITFRADRLDIRLGSEGR